MDSIIEFIDDELAKFDKILVTYEQIKEGLDKEGVKNTVVDKLISTYQKNIVDYNKIKEFVKTLK